MLGSLNESLMQTLLNLPTAALRVLLKILQDELDRRDESHPSSRAAS